MCGVFYTQIRRSPSGLRGDTQQSCFFYSCISGSATLLNLSSPDNNVLDSSSDELTLFGQDSGFCSVLFIGTVMFCALRGECDLRSGGSRLCSLLGIPTGTPPRPPRLHASSSLAANLIRVLFLVTRRNADVLSMWRGGAATDGSV